MLVNTTVTLDPEIVAGLIIYQIEVLFELYKLGRVNPANEIFVGQNSLVLISFGGKKSENCG